MVTVSADGSLTSVPRSFLGVSTEYWSLPLYAPRMQVFTRVLSLLHAPAAGPLLIRFGALDGQRLGPAGTWMQRAATVALARGRRG
jgi:hypothetical protein